MSAVSIDHSHVGDIESFPPNKRRQEAMQSVEKRQPQEQIAGERLQPAAGIDRAIPQDRATHGVGDAGLQFLETRRLAPRPLASHQSDPWRSGGEPLRHVGQEARIVLAVAIERDHERRPRGAHARCHRDRLAGRAVMHYRPHLGMDLHEPVEFGTGIVGRSVVDINDLERESVAQGRDDFRGELGDIVRFVADRHHDREFEFAEMGQPLMIHRSASGARP